MDSDCPNHISTLKYKVSLLEAACFDLEYKFRFCGKVFEKSKQSVRKFLKNCKNQVNQKDLKIIQSTLNTQCPCTGYSNNHQRS